MGFSGLIPRIDFAGTAGGTTYRDKTDDQAHEADSDSSHKKPP
jgi:hypothetical protein